jgi:hypothetical protein
MKRIDRLFGWIPPFRSRAISARGVEIGDMFVSAFWLRILARQATR